MNNFWEELHMNMSVELKKNHNKEVETMGLPSWVSLICPFCHEQCEPRAIRSIALNYNARNMGDVTVELCCDKCQKMDTLYYRKAAETLKDFINIINPENTADIQLGEPLIEDKMYKAQYNNLIERLIQKS